MEITCLFVSSRSAVLQLADGGLYNTLRPYHLRVNGANWGRTERVITSLYGLWPDTEYMVTVLDGDQEVGTLVLHTAQESVTLNVRRFGAVGDGVHDDTAAIQAAITCFSERGRVLIPRGRYLVTPLFLKSHLSLELAKGAELMLCTDRERFPILPGMTLSTDESREYTLGSWEGNPLDLFAALITGVDVEDVRVYGPGLLDGQAEQSDWWYRHKEKRGAWRGRMVYLCRCKDVAFHGVTVRNSPAWNLHPYFSEDLRFMDITVEAPAESPNTDGFNPESCKRVLLAGAHFSVGDDCIAIKSGKLYMGRTYRTPCEDISISHCLMEDGHGGVTVGSEMAGGVKNVRVSDCLMRHTERGLRIKTRRGRGKDGVVDDIVFERVRMEQVGAPVVVNCMYFCDPDGHSPWVQSREKQPVSEDTPRIGTVVFRQVRAEDCGACAGYFLGLPEQPIGRVTLEEVSFTYARDAQPMQPVAADGVPPCLHRGIIAKNVSCLELRGVTIAGQVGAALDCEAVDRVEGRGEA